MKQLPLVSGLLYATPWALLPAVHAEISSLYRGYLAGNFGATPPVALESQARLSSGISYESRDGIAVIHLSGIISKHCPDMLCGPDIIDLAKLDALLAGIGEDETIHTLVLDINSPGGSVVGLVETAANIRDLAGDGIRLIAFTDYQMCSAAYYIACACEEVYASPSAVVGSIGTYIAALDDSRAWELEGLELKLFRVGTLKATGHPGKRWSAEEEAHFQELADQAGADFRDWVVSRRPRVRGEAMEGQWFFAADAPAGLLDGFHRDLVRLLATLIGER